ncbi:MAG: hypothetical protein AAGF49_05215 [Pseudomonadota bacterium]
MLPEDVNYTRQNLPRTLPFPYFADRESPWLLMHRMRKEERVSELKASPLARFLDRPMVKPVVAACGGVLKREDVYAAAHADVSSSDPSLSRAGTAGVLAAFDLPWHDFLLSFETWAPSDELSTSGQMSRAGANLVIQLGFPSDHSALMGKYLQGETRKMFEYCRHPVRQSGRPTLAWARVDIEGKEALIEEVQTDWLRFAKERARELERLQPRSRHARAMRTYETDLRKRYDKLWPKAILLCTLGLLRDVLRVETVFMHQHQPGLELKHVTCGEPPRSLYTKLPRHFGFEPTQEAPHFLRKARRRKLATLSKGSEPLFWRLSV